MKAHELREAAKNKTPLIYQYEDWRGRIIEYRVIAIEKMSGQTWRIQTLVPPPDGEFDGPFCGRLEEDEDEAQTLRSLQTSSLSRNLFVESDLLWERREAQIREAEQKYLEELKAEQEERERIAAVCAVPESLFYRIVEKSEKFAIKYQEAALYLAKLGTRLAENDENYRNFDASEAGVGVETAWALKVLSAQLEAAMWRGGVPMLTEVLYEHAFEDADTGWSGHRDDVRIRIHEERCNLLRAVESDIKWFGKKEDVA